MEDSVIPSKLILGDIIITGRALSLLKQAGQNPYDFIFRHATGDWGEVTEEERALNEREIKRTGIPILSVYQTSLGDEIWVFTEWHEGVTSLLVPEECDERGIFVTTEEELRRDWRLVRPLLR